jgi:hypothetical protein
MSNLIIRDLPTDKILGKDSMSEIKGGSSAGVNVNGSATATGGNAFANVDTNTIAFGGPGFSVAAGTIIGIAVSYDFKPYYPEPYKFSKPL